MTFECVVVHKRWPLDAVSQTALVEAIPAKAWKRIAEMPDIVYNRGTDLLHLPNTRVRTKHGFNTFHIWHEDGRPNILFVRETPGEALLLSCNLQWDGTCVRMQLLRHLTGELVTAIKLPERAQKMNVASFRV